MRESQQLFLGLRLVSRIFEENQQSLWRIFQEIKGQQPIEAAQNFELFLNIQDQNKKIKNKAVYVLFKAFPMIPLSG
jgi:hypothetical protein